ncbi:MAG TPA: hypothetical protein PLF31_00385 [Candidatus Paceibacterota bacterium]|nr:hypothetical protein [Candidatus Paceibacterota bacterium]
MEKFEHMGENERSEQDILIDKFIFDDISEDEIVALIVERNSPDFKEKILKEIDFVISVYNKSKDLPLDGGIALPSDNPEEDEMATQAWEEESEETTEKLNRLRAHLERIVL